eukprot:gnl/TRDRNA2_/TRDRNA2_175144_c0_seq1.p1 gnl/TRDRNA2_/TRDRNA2_175144_c0~~gnl/TRDRNA2_/TRDRNA2_175144_c0_seq1.p1  ORF type:complete len:352 (+),score=-15.94 gnl/TRDRNA2_/TRDRNA2_175144_c0_seq1:929-1984(+)
MISVSYNSSINTKYQKINGQIYKSMTRGKIEPISDFKLPLLRHWTIYEATMNSIHVATRLQTWFNSGVKTAELWLAKMGFIPRDSKRNWLDVPIKLRTALSSSINKWADDFCLSDIRFPSFKISCSYTKEVTAADLVFATEALLLYDNHIKTDPHFSYYKNIFSDEKKSDKNSKIISGFWLAWQSLEFMNKENFETGIQNAKFVQKSIISQASQALSNKDVCILGKLRIYDMSLFNKHEDELKVNHNYLERIGRFIQDCYLFHTGKLRTCIIIGPPNEQELCLVVAKTHRSELIKIKQNLFGLVLNRAAEKAKINYRNPSFDSSVLEIHSKDITNFLSQLSIIFNEIKSLR